MMRLKNPTLRSGLLILAMAVLPVKSSDFADPATNQATVLVDITKNIATLEGRVASLEQLEQAVTLVFQLTEVDWIENKLKIDAAITTTHLSPAFISLISETSEIDQTAWISG